jgi:hypothetical protein
MCRAAEEEWMPPNRVSFLDSVVSPKSYLAIPVKFSKGATQKGDYSAHHDEPGSSAEAPRMNVFQGNKRRRCVKRQAGHDAG